MTEVKAPSYLYEDGLCVLCAPIQRDWPNARCKYHSNSHPAYSAYRTTTLPYLEEEMAAQDLTVEDLSRLSNVSEWSIENAISARRRTRFWTARALAEALDVPLRRLTGEEK
jgi:hypothetical protein